MNQSHHRFHGRFIVQLAAALAVTAATTDRSWCDDKPLETKKKEVARLATEMNGTANARIGDRLTVDVFTKDYAYEVAWSEKWDAALGNALHRAAITKKRAGVILLRSASDARFVERCVAAARVGGVRVLSRDVELSETTEEFTPTVNDRNPGVP